ncbi:hypothetical protein KC721_03930 [Candidatus Woesebacteria bacterium]|nr:hypothetical protein [Candidatus Woesebacteria bacterium]
MAKKKASSKKTVQIFPKTRMVIGLLIFLPILSFYLGMQFVIQTVVRTQSISVQTTALKNTGYTKESTKCMKYGKSLPEEYLVPYVTSKGETMMDIAISQLRDSSRVYELINLNKETYPDISPEEPFVEDGWIVYLPDPRWPVSSGNISELSAEVTKIAADDTWSLRGPNFATNARLTSRTLYPIEDVKEGDCVTIIREIGVQGNMLSVELQ